MQRRGRLASPESAGTISKAWSVIEDMDHPVPDCHKIWACKDQQTLYIHLCDKQHCEITAVQMLLGLHDTAFVSLATCLSLGTKHYTSWVCFSWDLWQHKRSVEDGWESGFGLRSVLLWRDTHQAILHYSHHIFLTYRKPKTMQHSLDHFVKVIVMCSNLPVRRLQLPHNIDIWTQCITMICSSF